MMIKKLTLLTLVTFFFACSQREAIKEKTVTAIKQINSFRDTIYFSRIEDMLQHNGDIFLVDYALGNIIRLNENLEYKTKLGRSGRGPLEISSPSLGYIANDQLFIKDAANSKIVSFSLEKNLAIQEYRFKYFSSGVFFVKDHNIIFNYRAENNPLVQYNYSNQTVVKEFGIAAEKSLNTPAKHLIPLKDGFFSIYGENKPLIEYYSHDGGLIKQFDFSDLTIFKDRLSIKTTGIVIKMKGNLQTPPVYKNIVWDAHFANDKLYLLVVSKKNETEGKSNNLLIMKWGNQELVPSELITLPEKGWYSRFCLMAQKDHILAFDQINGVLEVFDLSN